MFNRRNPRHPMRRRYIGAALRRQYAQAANGWALIALCLAGFGGFTLYAVAVSPKSHLTAPALYAAAGCGVGFWGCAIACVWCLWRAQPRY